MKPFPGDEIYRIKDPSQHHFIRAIYVRPINGKHILLSNGTEISWFEYYTDYTHQLTCPPIKGMWKFTPRTPSEKRCWDMEAMNLIRTITAKRL